MWAPPPPEPPPRGWWHELSYNRLVARGRADREGRELASEQAKRLRRLRRRAERANEQIVLALGADEARRHLRRQGYVRSAHHGYADESYRGFPIEHAAALGRVLDVR